MLNIRFLIQRYFVLFFNLLFQIILFKVFSVTNAGIISYGRTLTQYFDFTNLGFRNTLDKKKYKNEDSLRIIFSCVRTINIILSIILAVCLIIISTDTLVLVFFIISGILYADLFYIKLFYRNRGDKKKYVNKSFIFELIPLITLLLSILIFNNTTIVGILFFLSYILMYFIFMKDLKYIPLVSYYRISKKLFKKIISLNFSQGIYILLSSLLFFFLMAGDRILIKYFFGFEIIAQISFLMLFMNGFMPLIAALIEINMKELLHHFPISKILRILLIILIGAVFYICIIYLVQDIIVDNIFEKYIEVKKYVVYYTLLIIPCAIIQVTQMLLYRLNKQLISFYLFLGVVTIHCLLLAFNQLFSLNPIITILEIKLLSLSLSAIGMFIILITTLIRNKNKE